MVWNLINLLFPVTCLFCRQPLLAEEEAEFLCTPCSRKDPFFQEAGCPLCAARPGHTFCCARGEGKPFSFCGTVALGWYRQDLKECLHRLKYGGRSNLAKPLGQLLGRRVAEEGWPDLAAIVPIPLHPQRLKERGYNQSRLLARQVATSLALPLTDLLIRTQNTLPQAKMSRSERFGNLQGAFQLKTPPPYPLAGKTLLLVDDIFTTGATLEAASALLMSRGAGKVVNAVVAR
jgi:ComF family protein